MFCLKVRIYHNFKKKIKPDNPQISILVIGLQDSGKSLLIQRLKSPQEFISVKTSETVKLKFSFYFKIGQDIEYGWCGGKLVKYVEMSFQVARNCVKLANKVDKIIVSSELNKFLIDSTNFENIISAKVEFHNFIFECNKIGKIIDVCLAISKMFK